MSEYKEKQGAQVGSPKEVAVAPEAEVATKSKRAELAAPCLGAADTWRCARGAFALNGRRGRGIYKYGGVNYDTGWTLTDCLPVGTRKGWTYQEDGFVFYMFFSKSAASNGKFEILSSHDNQRFSHYCWAD